MTRGKLLVVSGPSGSGKSTLCAEALAQTGARLSVSATTRVRSEKEQEGKDYYFLSEADFEEKIESGEFLEYARVFDHYYGTPASAVFEQLESGQTVVLEIDVQGAGQVFEKFPEACGILILPPSDEELRRRLCDRGRDSEGTNEKRLSKAQGEIEQAQASGRYEHTIINDDLQTAIEALVKLIESVKCDK